VDRSLDDDREDALRKLGAVLAHTEEIAEVRDVRGLRLSLVREVLNKQRLKNRWQRRNELEQMLEERV
jgi:hypothetical protein